VFIFQSSFFLKILFVNFCYVGMRQGDPLVGLLFVLVHFHTMLFLGGFPFVSIPFLGPTHVISLAFVLPN
jgi:hypothetical protein